MKLRREIWEKSKVGELAIIKGGKRLPKGKTLVNYITEFPYIRVTDFENNSVNKNSILYLLEEDYIKIKNYSISNNDVFISIAGTIGLIGIIPEELDGANLTENAAKLVIKNNKILYQQYLLFALLSSNLQNQIKRGTATTAQPKLGLNKISNLEILLPPLEEQKQIAELFQSIENAIEQVDGQERNLKSLQKNLVDGLMKPTPEFGNLLNDNNCKTATFEAIAECDKKYPEHNKEVERFIGLENIEPENFQIQGFGLVSNGTTFTKRFAKGDVLFGKRRAYLKKVAVADFDGICSGDIIVIRSKGKSLLQGLLPYYISSEAFIYHAVSTSAGSLSPRTKWKDLAEMEVCIPDIKTQEKILEVFAQIDLTMKQLKQQKQTLKNLKQKLLNEILG